MNKNCQQSEKNESIDNSMTVESNIQKNSENPTQPKANEQIKCLNPLLTLNPNDRESMKQFYRKWRENSDRQKLYWIYESMDYEKRLQILATAKRCYQTIVKYDDNGLEECGVEFYSTLCRQFIWRKHKKVISLQDRRSNKELSMKQQQIKTASKMPPRQPSSKQASRNDQTKKKAGLFSLENPKSIFSKISSVFGGFKSSYRAQEGRLDIQVTQSLLEKNSNVD